MQVLLDLITQPIFETPHEDVLQPVSEPASQVMKLLGVLSHPSPSLADGLDTLGLARGSSKCLWSTTMNQLKFLISGASLLWSIIIHCAVVPSRSIVTHLILLSSVVISGPHACM